MNIQLEEISTELQDISLNYLGSGLQDVIFTGGRLKPVVGVRLLDGRNVVFKLYDQKADWAKLTATYEVQKFLFNNDYPCPRPVREPITLAGRFIMVEEYVQKGIAGKPHEPSYRRSMAKSLADQIFLMRRLPQQHTLRKPDPWMDYHNTSLWPRPHDSAFDFESTSEGAEWIDKMAAEAKQILLEPNDDQFVIGHGDWESQNMRFENSKVAVVWDWDSLVLEREEVIAGVASGIFTAQGDPDFSDAPEPSESSQYLDEYSEFANFQWNTKKRRRAGAAATWVISYNARCEHSIATGDSDTSESPYLSALRQYGNEYLRI